MTLPPPLSEQTRRDLLSLARQSIETALPQRASAPAWIRRAELSASLEAIFVTRSKRRENCVDASERSRPTATWRGPCPRSLGRPRSKIPRSGRSPPRSTRGVRIEISVLTAPQARPKISKRSQSAATGSSWSAGGAAASSSPRLRWNGGSTGSNSSTPFPRRRVFRRRPGATPTRASGSFRPRSSASDGAARLPHQPRPPRGSMAAHGPPHGGGGNRRRALCCDHAGGSAGSFSSRGRDRPLASSGRVRPQPSRRLDPGPGAGADSRDDPRGRCLLPHEVETDSGGLPPETGS